MTDALVIEAVRKSVIVACSVEEAFRLFTTDTLSWWPIESHSIHGAVSEIVFEPHAGGEVYELSPTGEKGHWATVMAWEPPRRLVLAWNILRREGSETEVEVRFLAEGAKTRVELEHRGWERVRENAEGKRADYDTGWGFVLGTFVDRI
jgi:uncharacterized protein YndB with AHSA1/START domain